MPNAQSAHLHLSRCVQQCVEAGGVHKDFFMAKAHTNHGRAVSKPSCSAGGNGRNRPANSLKERGGREGEKANKRATGFSS